MKPKLIGALWLWTLIGACSGAAPRNAPVAGESADELPPCRSPDQAGCAECCVEQRGPTADDQICYLRAVSEKGSEHEKSREYAEQAAFLNVGPCPVTCRPCAACTRDRKKSYESLRSRGCDCLDPFVRQMAQGIDPCFSSGCGCTCSQLIGLGECGPPL